MISCYAINRMSWQRDSRMMWAKYSIMPWNLLASHLQDVLAEILTCGEDTQHAIMIYSMAISRNGMA